MSRYLKTLKHNGKEYRYYSVPEYSPQTAELPRSLRILLESCLRNLNGFTVTEKDAENILNQRNDQEIPFLPARVVLQDFTGVPCIVDLAAMRNAVARAGGDPSVINPLIPVDLVIDHSVQVDYYAESDSLIKNMKMEFERNRERYEFLKWGQKSFHNTRIIPPGTGIVHQINLEYLATLIMEKNGIVWPDSLVGTDSHTTMINGLGVAGWGVGGIEAEAAMLGQPYSMLVPEVTGFRLTGELKEGTTATDLVLHITQILRSKGVVGKFVEFYGEGVRKLSIADRATIANMAPEYGATMGYFPVDQKSLDYMLKTGRSENLVSLIKAYYEAQDLFYTSGSQEPQFRETIELDLSSVEPSLAGPKRPQDRVSLKNLKKSFQESLTLPPEKRGFGIPADRLDASGKVSETDSVSHGSVVLAAITSCTNTSNPEVMIAAGLVAKKAVEKGLSVKPWIKTSLAPGSRVVTDYLNEAGLTPYLDTLGFRTVGYGCTTCIGNSGPLPDSVSSAVEQNGITAAGVLSGNRNFEGRINPHIKANYLASPPLVVAFALKGSVQFDPGTDPIGKGNDGTDIYLRDIWPSREEIETAVHSAVKKEQFSTRYSEAAVSGEEPGGLWSSIPAAEGLLFRWNPESSYIREVNFFENFSLQGREVNDIEGARALVKVGDSVTTDHISPAGNIASGTPADAYLRSCGIDRKDYNSYGARRGNHEVMVRGTFANIRLRNQLAPGTEGGMTQLLPENHTMSIFDASLEYKKRGTPLIVLAGKEYGTGSSRDWAAKGTMLLGVKAVIAESFERIHRSNLAGMGVLPLQYPAGESAETLGLTGRELFSIKGISDSMKPGEILTVTAESDNGNIKSFQVICRLDSMSEIVYYRNGGILQTALIKFLS